MIEHVAITFGKDAYNANQIYMYSSMQHLLDINGFCNNNALNEYLQIPDDAWDNDTLTKYDVPRLHIILSNAQISLENFKRHCFALSVTSENTFNNQSLRN